MPCLDHSVPDHSVPDHSVPDDLVTKKKMWDEKFFFLHEIETIINVARHLEWIPSLPTQNVKLVFDKIPHSKIKKLDTYQWFTLIQSCYNRHKRVPPKEDQQREPISVRIITMLYDAHTNSHDVYRHSLTMSVFRSNGLPWYVCLGFSFGGTLFHSGGRPL